VAEQLNSPLHPVLREIFAGGTAKLVLEGTVKMAAAYPDMVGGIFHSYRSGIVLLEKSRAPSGVIGNILLGIFLGALFVKYFKRKKKLTDEQNLFEG